MSFEVKQESPVPMAEVKAELEKISKRDTELNFRAQKTDDYLKQFQKLSQKNTEELIQKLLKLNIPRLKEQHIYKIVDLMPKTPENLKAVLQGYTLTVNNENLKKIVDIVSEYES